jgi:hypothetical protein
VVAEAEWREHRDGERGSAGPVEWTSERVRRRQHGLMRVLPCVYLGELLACVGGRRLAEVCERAAEAIELFAAGRAHAQVLVERGEVAGEWMRLALVPKLALLPAPAHTLTLRVESFGPATNDQKALLEDPAKLRRDRLREAVRQARTVAGPDTALRVLQIDPTSRFPERRVVLTPFER